MSTCYTRRIEEDEFSFLEKELKSLSINETFVFGNLTYGMDFHRHYFPPEKEGAFGKTLYYLGSNDTWSSESSEMGVIFFGEICPMSMGTMMSSKGNYYIGGKNPKVSD